MNSESTMIQDLRTILLRDLDTLVREVEAYPSDDLLWRAPPGVPNAAGTLALHLAGNLHHYVGTVLGGAEYVRDREGEFGDRDLPRRDVAARIRATRETVARVLGELDPERLREPFPVEVGGVRPGTGIFLMHLAVHFGYHLGQIDYHRRVVTETMAGVDAQSVRVLGPGGI